jgi:phage tail-like protein
VSRGTITGLSSPYPIGEQLPAVYQEDPFTMRLTAAFDELLAPAPLVLDCLGAYLDPALAPADFLPWLGDWVGAELPDDTPTDRRRAVLAVAIALHRDRGTVAGLRAQFELLTGAPVRVRDSGGVRSSDTPGTEPPGAADPEVTVALPAGTDPAVVARVEYVLARCRPAHVRALVLVDGGQP